jgi:hypothetical protein
MAPDFDGDASPDCADADDDDDGTPDVDDAFPFDDTEDTDTDGDGTGDNADADDDGDGQSDADEIACGSDPLDAAVICTSALAPVAVPGGPYLVAVGGTIMLDGSASYDPDGSVGTFEWSPSTDLSDATLANPVFSGDAPGVFPMTLSVTDLAGNSGSADTMVVVYDPDGGFVTGGGWFDSPAGAYVADPDLTGKATFGFVAKYHNGANVPEGSTEFQFKSGSLKFRATDYDWLVTPGMDKGKFKGSGDINGGGDYGFMMTVVDNGNNGDTFRIKIWDKQAGDGVVYDNKMGQGDEGYDGTVIGGGNIKVHKN